MRTSRSVPTLLVLALSALSLAVLATPAAAACHVAGFESSQVDVDEGAGEVTLTVFLQGRQPSCEGTVDFATEDGTATAGSDYEAASGTLTFASGDDREETITITVLADDEAEGSEDFQVVLSNPTGSISGTSDPATVTITDAASGGGDEPTSEPTDEPTSDAPTSTATTPAEAADGDDASSGTPWVLIVVVLVVVVGGGIAFAARRGGAGGS